MKKPLLLLSLLFVLASCSTFAQSTKYGWLTKESWSLGFGFTYPKYMSTNLAIKEDMANLGGYLSIQRNYSEHIGLRAEIAYLGLKGNATFVASGIYPKRNFNIKSSTFIADLDLLYYFVPCEPISPYLGVGLGGLIYSLSQEPTKAATVQNVLGSYDGTNVDYQFNILFGANWRIGENWKLKSELQYHTGSTSHLDGLSGTGYGGLLGAGLDSYMSAELGLLYYFGYGEKSHICEAYEGISYDYDKIEEIVKKYAVQPVDVDYNRIEDIVKRNRPSSNVGGGTIETSNWVLIGCNFDFGKATIRPESYPILYNAAQILLSNPDIKVEIQGHTDNVGSDSYNQKLSLQRAEAVKNFLIAKGVAADRLTTVGLGETKPAIDNNTADTRALNRRIEFKVVK